MARKTPESKALKQAKQGVHVGGPTDADAIVMSDRLRSILQYRIAGASLQQIADKFEISTGRVHQIISEAVQRIPKHEVETIRMMECERLDAMQMAMWPAALKGDIGAVSTILAVMNRRARYLGLDVAEAIDATFIQKAGADDAKREFMARIIAIRERNEAGKAAQLTGPTP